MWRNESACTHTNPMCMQPDINTYVRNAISNVDGLLAVSEDASDNSGEPEPLASSRAPPEHPQWSPGREEGPHARIAHRGRPHTSAGCFGPHRDDQEAFLQQGLPWELPTLRRAKRCGPLLQVAPCLTGASQER